MTSEDVVDHRAHFDTVAIRAHDRQKDWPEALWSDLVDALATHLDPPCVEVGVGTGLVARRICAPERDVFGIDLNPSMLRSLRQRAPGIPVVLADATALPVATGGAGSVLLSNVLHLIDDWRIALTEVARAVKPGGCLAINLGTGGAAPPEATEVRRSFLAKIPELGRARGPSDEAEMFAALDELGFEQLPPVEARGTTYRTIRDVIDRLEHNPFVWPSGTSRQLLATAAADVRARAQETLGSIDRPLAHRVDVRFSISRRTARLL